MIVIGLETLREQLNAVKKISLKEQCKMLIELIKNPDEIEDKFNQLLNAYLKPDFGAILKLATDKNLPENFSNVFLEKRNKVMTGRIAKYIKKSSTFNAVGAGHLIGRERRLMVIRKGFTVKPSISPSLKVDCSFISNYYSMLINSKTTDQLLLAI